MVKKPHLSSEAH